MTTQYLILTDIVRWPWQGGGRRRTPRRRRRANPSAFTRGESVRSEACNGWRVPCGVLDVTVLGLLRSRDGFSAWQGGGRRRRRV